VQEQELPPCFQVFQILQMIKSASVFRGKQRIAGRQIPRRGPALPSFHVTEMEGTQDRPRKKIPLNTACWDCYRSHRGCDGLRPCKRCVDLRRGASCRDPAPDERILRKRKRFNSKDASKGAFTVTSQQGFIMDPRIFLSPITRVIKTETCISPPSSTFAFDPSVQPTSPPDREFNCESEDLEPTNSRRFTPQQQLILDQPPTCSYLSRRQPTQITMIYVPPSVEALIEEICVETEETADHRKTTTSVFQSLSVPDDMLHLTESFFTPFGLRDSTQVRARCRCFVLCFVIVRLFVC